MVYTDLNLSEMNDSSVHWDWYPLMCDVNVYVPDDIGKINKDNVQNGSLIFIKTDLLRDAGKHRKWRSEILKRLNELWMKWKIQVHIVCHNSDYPCPSPYENHKARLDRNEILTIFSNQVDADHQFEKTKVYSIAQGLVGGGLFENAKRIWENKTKWDKKENKMVLTPGCWQYGHNSHSEDLSPRTKWYPELQEKYSETDWFIGFPEDHRVHDSNWTDLFDKHKYQITIPGLFGCQVNRLWEGLIHGCVPIQRRNCWLWSSGVEELCETHNIPSVWVDDWDELKDMKDELFQREFDFSSVLETFKMSYWRDFIYEKIGR